MAEALFDTSVWVTLFEGDEAAMALTELSEDIEAVSSPIVLAELASLEARGRMRGGPLIDSVLANARIEELTHEDAIAAGKLHGRLRVEGNEKVGLADCLLYATARRIGALFVTFDGDLSGQPGVRILGIRKRGKKV